MTNSGTSGADASPELDQVEKGTASQTSAGQGPAQHSRRANRLIGETSPYLLQHAYNPVDWYPWGTEALELARALDKPILLSIGYAACHWCHVMERESFEDQQTADHMNEKFVSIKVDREERPDIDAIYMDAVQAMTRHGGWPMTMFLAPDGIPFYGGTYFPPDDRHGLPSFRNVLTAVAEAWADRREELLAQGKHLVQQLDAYNRAKPSSQPISSEILQSAVRTLSDAYDAEYGGFGNAPKFPQAPVLEYVLRAAGAGFGQSKQMIDHTLERMARGGIYDQLAGGFARYSVDPLWLVPHFEKMLYDNAQLARVYTHAWQLLQRPLYKRIALETLDYLLNEMRDDAGGFHSSEDADSEGVEGKFYVWSYEEFMEIAPDAAGYYGVTRGGNFEGSNILTARDDDPPQEARSALLEHRAKRVRPGRDDKVLTSWNALTISALAEAYGAFQEPRLLTAAEETASFILDTMVQNGRLMHSFRGGDVRVLGMLEDYAYLSEALYVLWEVSGSRKWLQASIDMTRSMIELFGDEGDSALFSTARDHEKLILRQKEIVESATPSPNAVACVVLLKLGMLLEDSSMTKNAEAILSDAHHFMHQAPQATGTFLSAADFYLSGAKQIVLTGDPENEKYQAMQSVLWEAFTPNKIVVHASATPELPLSQGKGEEVAAYVCENYTCKAPVTTPAELKGQL